MVVKPVRLQSARTTCLTGDARLEFLRNSAPGMKMERAGQ